MTIDSPNSETIYPCTIEGCSREFTSSVGIGVHMYRTHGFIKDTSPKIPEGQTQCTNCKKEFKTEKALWSHGSPEVCKERLKKNYAELTCEYCGKKWVGYIGRASGKGTKFCSTKCMG